MKKAFQLAIAICCIVGFCACKGSDYSRADSRLRQGIPSKAQFVDENDYYEVFVDEEVPAKDWMDVAKVSLWLYNKSTKGSSRLLTTVKPESFWWYQSDGINGVDYPIDSITAIHKIIPVDSTTLIVEGCPDNRNLFSYIIDIPNRKATYIPCNSGIVGFTSEEGLIIGQSYRYVSDPDIAGRYTYLQVFDWNGNQVAHLDLEREHVKNGVLDVYFDFQPETNLVLKSYMADCDFKFPVEGDQYCWEYIYSFDEFSEKDLESLDKLVVSDKNWTQTANGYRYLYIDKEYGLNAEATIDLAKKELIFIHGVIND